MFEEQPGEAPAGAEQPPAEQALREGLRRLPVPEPSPDFDGRVLAALERPAAWGWLADALRWRTLRPVLAGAIGSLALTLGLYAWSARLPLEGASMRATNRPAASVVERALHPAVLRAATPALLSSLRRVEGQLPEKRPAPAPAPQNSRPGRTPGRSAPGRSAA